MRRGPRSRTFRPWADALESRNLLTIIPTSPAVTNINMVAGGSTITFRTIGSFTADNVRELVDNSWNTGEAPFDAVVAINDGGASNLFNPHPTVLAQTDELGMTGKFTIDWGNKMDVIGAMLVPNADYTSFSVELAYRPLVPGDYNYAVVIMGADGSNATLTGTIHATGNPPSSGGNTYRPQGPLVTQTDVDLATLWN